ncbi:MAG: hypothetical protein KAW12_06500 [Candidatus Aminicenantes bacterium]|nr:hypothetical protein [Candidatus Aminicenantes bacterium]
MKYIKTKKVKYRVQCAAHAGHIFEKVFQVEEGGEAVESSGEAFCPYCDEMVPVEVKGKAPLDKEAQRFLRQTGVEA